MTRYEVQRYFEIWKMYEPQESCECADHHADNKNVCKRERAWRDYCQARDIFIKENKTNKKKPDRRDLFESFDNGKH
jgi:hypothetical protein